jgi:bifunctional DNA-binding transcriptional regulator/antitoxin component of YhaV-PrlF toxin-antitoxin module
MEITRLSSKGQIIIPYAIRSAHKWPSGLEFAVTDTPQGVLFTPIKPFKPTTLHSVLGCVGYKGAKKSLKDMERGVAKGASERR